jgi:hypothetical protein
MFFGGSLDGLGSISFFAITSRPVSGRTKSPVKWLFVVWLKDK